MSQWTINRFVMFCFPTDSYVDWNSLKRIKLKLSGHVTGKLLLINK